MDSPQIDRNTSRSICNAVGERLQRDLRPEASPLSPQLQHLMEELRRQDGEAPPEVVPLTRRIALLCEPPEAIF